MELIIIGLFSLIMLTGTNRSRQRLHRSIERNLQQTPRIVQAKSASGGRVRSYFNGDFELINLEEPLAANHETKALLAVRSGTRAADSCLVLRPARPIDFKTIMVTRVTDQEGRESYLLHASLKKHNYAVRSFRIPD